MELGRTWDSDFRQQTIDAARDAVESLTRDATQVNHAPDAAKAQIRELQRALHHPLVLHASASDVQQAIQRYAELWTDWGGYAAPPVLVAVATLSDAAAPTPPEDSIATWPVLVMRSRQLLRYPDPLYQAISGWSLEASTLPEAPNLPDAAMQTELVRESPEAMRHLRSRRLAAWARGRLDAAEADQHAHHTNVDNYVATPTRPLPGRAAGASTDDRAARAGGALAPGGPRPPSPGSSTTAPAATSSASSGAKLALLALLALAFARRR